MLHSVKPEFLIYYEFDLEILINFCNIDFATGDNCIFSMSFKLLKLFPTITRPNIPELPCGVQ